MTTLTIEFEANPGTDDVIIMGEFNKWELEPMERR